MANKISYALMPMTTIQNNLTHWQDINRKIRTCFELADPNSEGSSSANRIVAYNHCQSLHSINFITLFFHQIVSDTQPDRQIDSYPAFFYDFILQIPYDQEARRLSPQQIETFVTQLQQISTHPIPPAFQEMLKALFQENTYLAHHVHTLTSFRDVKSRIPLDPHAIFANFLKMFEQLKVVLPYIESRYVKAFPASVFSGKTGFETYRQQWREGLGHLSKMKKFMVKVHSLLSKVRNADPLTAFSDEITHELCTLSQIFTQGTDTGILKMYDPVVINRFKDLRDTIAANQVDSIGYTVEELNALVTFMEEMNKTFKLLFFIISFPICDMTLSQRALRTLKPNQYKKVISSEAPPHFYFPPVLNQHDPLNLNSILMATPAPVSPPKKIKLTREPRVPIASSSSSSSSSSSTVNTTQTTTQQVTSLFLQVRQKLPMLPGATASAPLMQCVIYIDDLEGAQKLPDSTLKCVFIWNSLFRLMEQALRLDKWNKTLQDVRDHNLHNLAINTPVDPLLLNKISGTNRWIEYTFESLRQRVIKGSQIPKILSEMSRLPSSEPHLDSPLVDEVLHNLNQVLSATASFNIENRDKKLTLDLPFTPLQMPSLNDRLKAFTPQSNEAIKLQEVQKDLHLLNHLEQLLQNPLSTALLPTVVRMVAKVHHSILEHLLLTIYYMDHFEEKREHQLDKLTNGVSTLTPALNQSLGLLFNDLHRLSNYPFDADRPISEWHVAIVQAEVIRAMPELIGTDRFVPVKDTIVMGGVQVDLKNLSPDPIVAVVKKSRALLNEFIPRLLEEIALKLT